MWFWQFSPDIVLVTAVAVVLYFAGQARLRGRASSPGWARALGFCAGMLLIFLALESPIDSAADHSFAIHQIQHLLLHSAGPMLVMLAAPQGTVVAGIPLSWRPWIVQPLSSRAVRGPFGLLSQPIVATTLFIGSLIFWELPRWHQLAVAHEDVHYVMHMTMMIAGLLFFHRVFDPRPEPYGVSVPKRMLMVLAALVANIGVGAFTTLKSAVIYPVYAANARLPGLGAMSDEQFGGLIIWIPGSMMLAITILLLLRLWGRQESRADARRRQGLPAVGAPRGVGAAAHAAAQNRGLALGLGAVAVVAFVLVFVVGALSAQRLDAPPMQAAVPMPEPITPAIVRHAAARHVPDPG